MAPQLSKPLQFMQQLAGQPGFSRNQTIGLHAHNITANENWWKPVALDNVDEHGEIKNFEPVAAPPFHKLHKHGRQLQSISIKGKHLLDATVDARDLSKALPKDAFSCHMAAMTHLNMLEQAVDDVYGPPAVPVSTLSLVDRLGQIGKYAQQMKGDPIFWSQKSGVGFNVIKDIYKYEDPSSKFCIHLNPGQALTPGGKRYTE